MPAALEFSNVSFTYPASASPVLRDLNLRIEDGAFCLLTGVTGSGKSTLLSLAKPELAPAGQLVGEVRVFGKPVNQVVPRDSSLLVGLVQQDPSAQIVCDSVWQELAFGMENLAAPPELMRLRIAETCHFFGIEPWFRRKTSELSGGERQLLALASALVMRPKLLLLDEPTAMLDPVAEKNLAHALFRVNRELGVTVLVATHRPEALEDYATCRFALTDDGTCGDVSDAPSERAALGEAKNLPGPSMGRYQATAGNALELHDVWWRYEHGGPWVLRGCSLSVPSGSAHALCGGNGCGKSTLLALASGVRAPQRGKVRHAEAIKGSVALLPQDPMALFACDSVAEELVEFRAKDDTRDAAVLAEAVGLPADTELLARSAYDLSGGERQLVALAKLLAARPRLLLLDEPGKGLDTRAKSLLVDALRAFRSQGVTLLLATHDLGLVAEIADSVTLLFDGQAAATLSARDYLAETFWA